MNSPVNIGRLRQQSEVVMAQRLVEIEAKILNKFQSYPSNERQFVERIFRQNIDSLPDNRSKIQYLTAIVSGVNQERLSVYLKQNAIENNKSTVAGTSFYGMSPNKTGISEADPTHSAQSTSKENLSPTESFIFLDKQTKSDCSMGNIEGRKVSRCISDAHLLNKISNQRSHTQSLLGDNHFKRQLKQLHLKKRLSKIEDKVFFKKEIDALSMSQKFMQRQKTNSEQSEAQKKLGKIRLSGENSQNTKERGSFTKTQEDFYSFRNKGSQSHKQHTGRFRPQPKQSTQIDDDNIMRGTKLENDWSFKKQNIRSYISYTSDESEAEKAENEGTIFISTGKVHRKIKQTKSPQSRTRSKSIKSKSKGKGKTQQIGEHSFKKIKTNFEKRIELSPCSIRKLQYASARDQLNHIQNTYKLQGSTKLKMAESITEKSPYSDNKCREKWHY